jgi:hypothetical protein
MLSPRSVSLFVSAAGRFEGAPGLSSRGFTQRGAVEMGGIRRMLHQQELKDAERRGRHSHGEPWERVFGVPVQLRKSAGC